MNSALACVIGDLSLLRPLGIAGVPVVAVVTSRANAHVSHSRYVKQALQLPDDAFDLEARVRALMRFAADQKERPVLYFETDDDLLMVSRYRDQLAPLFRFAVPTAEQVEDLVDKKRFAALADRLDLPTPKTLVFNGSSVAHDGRARAWRHFPCILKPAVRTHWFGVQLDRHVIGATQKAIRVDTRAELDALCTALAAHPSDFILQELVEGGEEQIVSYHAYVRAGVVVADFTGRKIRTTPQHFGFSSYVEITDDARVRSLGREVVSRMELSGVIKLDFKEDIHSRRLYLLEGNPRFNLWHHPGALAGVNLPLLVYRDLLEPGSVKVGAAQARVGVRWMSAALDLRGLAEAGADGGVSRLDWVRQLASADIVEDLCWSDPLPSVVRLFHRVQLRAQRAWASRERAALAVKELG